MKRILNLSFLLICCLSINGQTISFKTFQAILNKKNLEEVIETINNLGFNLQSVQDHKAGEKGIEAAGKAVYWSYNCDYIKSSDNWAVKPNIFWSYLRLVNIGGSNAILDLTLNINFSKDYMNKFKESLVINGFKSDVHLDSENNSIMIFYKKNSFKYLVSITQTTGTYIISFISTEDKF